MKKKAANQYPGRGMKGVSRRHFVKIAGMTAVGVSSFGTFDFYSIGVSIISDPTDLISGSSPVQWAILELEKSLISRRIRVSRFDRAAKAETSDIVIIVSASDSSL
jgi:hypothetical protein